MLIEVEMMKPTSIEEGLWRMWRDLTTEPGWKYEELPPLLLVQVTRLDLFEVGYTELDRAHWFWSRRPKLTFHESVCIFGMQPAPYAAIGFAECRDSGAALAVMGLCVLPSAAIVAVVALSGTSIPERVAEIIILLLELAVEIYLIVQRLRFVHWRREYERSIDRLIRAIHPSA
jgi:hypothetical protein